MYIYTYVYITYMYIYMRNALHFLGIPLPHVKDHVCSILKSQLDRHRSH